MKNFDVPYVDNNTYPKRLDDCLESLCQQAGLVLGSKNFPNNSYMIKGNPFTNGETRKTVLSNLVQLTGGFAEVDIEDGKLYVRNLDVSGEPVETIDGNNYDEFKPNNVFGSVNSIRLLMNSGVDGEETIKEADGVTDENRCQITIADNYYLTSAEEREAVIDGIFNALNGLTYLPVEINYYGYPWLKLGSKIKVKDKNDNEYITYVMEHTLKYNGAYSGKIKATALTKTQVSYKETTSLKQFKRNTELAVDKINGKIISIIEEQTETNNKIAEQKITVDEMSSKISDTASNVNEMNNNLTELNETVASTKLKVDEYEIKFEEKTKTINEELKENSETIKSMSYTFNTDELSIAKSDDPVNAKINNSGMRVYSYNELKAIFNDKGTGIQKLIVVGSAQIGNLQIVKATDENGEACTDFHHLVSNIQNLEDLEVG